jgi:hypothetical protein
MEISILQSKIHEVRGQKVMLDFDLALLYKVETRVLNQAVKRNISRFPEDFMFQLTLEEMENMSSQFVTTYPSKRPKTALPFAFTEQGIAMLSGILNSEVAININIAIMRTFVIMRRFALEHKEFNSKLLEIESKYDKQFSDIYEALNFLIKRDENESIQKGRKQIGYKKQ